MTPLVQVVRGDMPVLGMTDYDTDDAVYSSYRWGFGFAVFEWVASAIESCVVWIAPRWRRRNLERVLRQYPRSMYCERCKYLQRRP